MMRTAVIGGSRIGGVTEVKRRAEAEETRILGRGTMDRQIDVEQVRGTETETPVALNGGM